MKITFVGAAYLGRSWAISAEECVNFYPEGESTGSNTVSALVGTPGLVEWVDMGTSAVIRGLYAAGAYLYAVVNTSVYQIDTDGNKTLIATLTTSSGVVEMRFNGTELMLIDGAKGYTFTVSTSTWAEIADADFPDDCTSLAYLDGYFFVSKRDSQQMQSSDLRDGMSWAAANYATAEGDPDGLVAVREHNQEIWAFGEKTTEIWWNAANAAFPLSRRGGAVLEFGLAARHSVARADNSMFWMGRDRYGEGLVFRSSGYQAKRISTHALEYQINSYGSAMADARGYIYQEEGHTFYVLSFDTKEGFTWAYDLSTGLWHERRSLRTLAGVEIQGRHRGCCHAWFNNWHIIGDFENGKLYKQSLAYYDDAGEYIRRYRSAPVMRQEQANVFFKRLEVKFEPGVGLITGQGSTPYAALQWSDDNGRTWSSEKWVSVGAIGKYKTRAVWRRLGAARNRVFRVIVSDPVRWVVTGAAIDAVAGES